MRRTILYCTRAVPLSRPAITQALQNTPGWRLDGNNANIICRDFEFHNFSQAMLFMNKVGEHCEAVNHHPCWTNIYNKVQVRLTTHDAGNKVTQKDIDLARKMNDVFKSKIIDL